MIPQRDWCHCLAREYDCACGANWHCPHDKRENVMYVCTWGRRETK